MEKFLCVNAMVSTTNFQYEEVETNMCYEDEAEDYYEMLDKQSVEDELISFISALFEYSAELEEQVIKLRRTVNELSDKERLPFPDLEGDIYQVFDDFSAYRKYQTLIEERIEWNKTHPISEIMKRL
jgi:hypothetical protein